jgi:signal peptidase I
MRFLRMLGTVAMVLVCLAAVAFAALSLASRGAPADVRTWAGGYKPFVVLSGSMEPGIRVGSVLLVKRADPAAVRKGDVITFLTPRDVPATGAPGTITTHRVVGVDHDAQGHLSFQTKGDANKSPDPLRVPAPNVLGSAVFTVPYLGYVSRFASTKTGLLALIVGPASLLVLLEIVSLVRGRSRGPVANVAQEES